LKPLIPVIDAPEEIDWKNYGVGRLTRIDSSSDDEKARVSWEFDCLSRKEPEVEVPQEGWLAFIPNDVLRAGNGGGCGPLADFHNN
jgi:hypothetical protein